MTENITNQAVIATEAKILDRVSERDAMLAQFTPEELEHAERARSHGARSGYHLLCQRIYQGKVTLSLKQRPDKYGESLIEWYAKDARVSASLLYQMADLVEALPEPVFEWLIKLGQSKKEHADLVCLGHIRVLHGAQAPQDPAKRAKRDLKYLKQVVARGLKAAELARLLAKTGKSKGSGAAEEAKATTDGAAALATSPVEPEEAGTAEPTGEAPGEAEPTVEQGTESSVDASLAETPATDHEPGDGQPKGEPVATRAEPTSAQEKNLPLLGLLNRLAGEMAAEGLEDWPGEIGAAAQQCPKEDAAKALGLIDRLEQKCIEVHGRRIGALRDARKVLKRQAG